MQFGVFGTGVVGQTIAGKLADLGHSVLIGTRNTTKTPQDGFSEWQSAHPKVELVTFANAAKYTEILVNATSGAGSLDALHMAGTENINGKILIDISNPLDFSKGMPPSLSICNDSSLGEQIQKEFPHVKLVKTLNTMSAALMINPSLLKGDHSVFVNGNDPVAKSAVMDLLSEFGWKRANIIDLGDITASRGTEMYLPLWLRMFGAFQTPLLNINVVR